MQDRTSDTTLLCVPFAGAGLAFFRQWVAGAPAGVSITPLLLPGRERRIDDDPHRDVHEAVDELIVEVRRGCLTQPIVLFGHSLGAVLAFELAHRLVRIPGADVRHLVVSGSPAPDVQRDQHATGLPDDDFLDQVSEFAGYTHEALAHPEMRAMILPTLRADVEMHERYRPSTRAALAVPVTSVRGADDTLVTADEAAAWGKFTSRDFTYTEVPGGHMYLVDSAPILSVIAAAAR